MKNYRSTRSKTFIFGMFCVSILVYNTSFTQENSLEVYGGGITCNLRFSHSFNSNFKNGLHFSAGYDRKIKNNLYVGANFDFVELGGISRSEFMDSVGNYTGEYQDFETDLSYIQVPLKIGVHYGTDFYFLTNIGFVTRMLIKATHEELQNTGEEGQYETVRRDITNQSKMVDFAFQGELAIGKSIFENHAIFLSTRFNHSLSSFGGHDYYLKSEVRNYGISYLFGYKFYF